MADFVVALNGDAVIACADLVNRAGATQFKLGYLHDDVPIEEAGWYAHAQYRGARITVEDRRSPSEAALALAERLLRGAACRCGKTITLNDDGGGCRWQLQGKRWQPGCDAPPLHVDGPRGDLGAMNRAMRRAAKKRGKRNATKHIWPESERAILAVPLTPRPSHRGTNNAGTRRRVQALSWMGWPTAEVARRAGVRERSLATLIRPSRRVSQTLASRVAQVYDQLSGVPGPSRGARAKARQLGHAPPAAWDDDTIDDPKARPHGVRQGLTDDPAKHGKCCGAATGDDGLCDRCRTTCNKTETPEQSVAPGPGTENALPAWAGHTGI